MISFNGVKYRNVELNGHLTLQILWQTQLICRLRMSTGR